MLFRLWIVGGLYALNAAFAQTPLSLVVTGPILVLVVIGLGRLRSPSVQLGDVFWFCVFVFFVLSPIQRMGVGMIGGQKAITLYHYTPDDFAWAGAMVFLFLLPFLLVRMEVSGPPKLARTISQRALLAWSMLAFAAFTISSGGLSNVLAPRLEQETGFIATYLFLAGQSVAATLCAAAWARQRSFGALTVLILAIGLLAISRNPFNASRFTLIGTWFPVILALVQGRLPVGLFYGGALALLLVVFPILNLTTRMGVAGLGGLSDVDLSGTFLAIPFIDVFDTLVHTVRFMSTHDWMGGQKLMAIVLFFIPRAFWTEKPIVGGLDIGHQLHGAGMAGTPNLSHFIAGDFFMDFGWLGVGCGGFATAFALSCVLRWRIGRFFDQSLLPYFLMSAAPIVLRGPVGAVLALIVCQLAVLWVASRFRWKAVTPVSVLLPAMARVLVIRRAILRPVPRIVRPVAAPDRDWRRAA